MISLRSKGDFSKTEKLLKKTLGRNYLDVLAKYGAKGCLALAANTPIDTGLLASSWYYEVIQNESSISVVWSNSDIENGINIAILIQYGHGTRGGTFVQGVDYINPALKPIFDELAEAAWKEVTSL